jgi:hypothetical protein
MSSCARCIHKPFCQSPGPVCSSFKDQDRFADRDEVIREFAKFLIDHSTDNTISIADLPDLVIEMTEENK